MDFNNSTSALMPQQAVELPQAAAELQNIPHSTQDDDDEHLWQAVGDVQIPPENAVELPNGCPDTITNVHSYKEIQKARKEATEDQEIKYNSQTSRARMTSELSTRSNGMIPRFYQLDCAEAFLLGMDTGLICATWSGKTEAFVLPLLAYPQGKSMLLVVSTLRALQADQVCCTSLNEQARLTICALYFTGQEIRRVWHHRGRCQW